MLLVKNNFVLSNDLVAKKGAKTKSTLKRKRLLEVHWTTLNGCGWASSFDACKTEKLQKCEQSQATPGFSLLALSSLAQIPGRESNFPFLTSPSTHFLFKFLVFPTSEGVILLFKMQNLLKTSRSIFSGKKFYTCFWWERVNPAQHICWTNLFPSADCLECNTHAAPCAEKLCSCSFVPEHRTLYISSRPHASNLLSHFVLWIGHCSAVVIRHLQIFAPQSSFFCTSKHFLCPPPQAMRN